MSSHRSIRLFLSSTFRDFGEERDLLVKRVFPALRAKLKDRFVELVDVDLRWGITAAEAERGEVLPICLTEIDRARPYFIGMLGERYGWVPPPDGYAADLLERQPWLKKHQGGKSVTELEILHGVLNNRRMQGRAFFYFRSPAYARTKGGDYLPSPEDRTRQTELKRRIRERGLPVTSYANPEALAKRIERDLWKLLDAEFPASEVPDAFERERLRHEAYAAPRRRLYLGGERYQAALAKLLEAEEPRIVIEGASGGGKSALLANFFEAYRKRRPRHLVHEHYLGASADAADPHALVRRLIEFIQRTTGSTEEIPGDPQKLMDSLPIWLATASAWARRRRTRFIFVLDSLNSLTDQKDLRWWPAFLPKGITMLVSCLPGPVHDALKGKTEALPGQDKPPQWKTVTVRPLTKAQSETLLNTYLARFNKKLPRQMVKQVQAHPLATNPIFLRTLAEELRLFGVHEELQKRLDHYLTSQTIDDLFERVLERVEKDCGKMQVKAAMTAIWASRAGLTEKEILGIADLKPATWAPIRHALDEALMDAEGKITFAHDYMRSGVRDRYLQSEAKKRDRHRKLARWFQSRPVDQRRVQEEPFQWRLAGSWSDLKICLTDRLLFEALKTHTSSEELWGYWLLLEAHTKARAEKAYAAVWAKWKARTDHGATEDVADSLAQLLRYAGRYGRFTEVLLRTALAIREKTLGLDHPDSLGTAHRLALLLSDRGELAGAATLHRRVLTGRERTLGPEHLDTLKSINGFAIVLWRQGDYAGAEVLYRRALAGREKILGLDHPDTLMSINNLAVLLSDRGDSASAEVLHRRALAVRERVFGPEHPDTLMSIHNLAGLLEEQGKHAEAEVLYRRALALGEKVLGPEHPTTLTSLSNLAILLREQGDPPAVEVLHRRVVVGREKVLGPDHPDTLRSLCNLALLLDSQGHPEEAEALHRRAIEGLEVTLGPDHPDTLWSVSNLAIKLKDRGDLAGTEVLHRRVLAGQEKRLGLEHLDTLWSVDRLAVFLSDRGDHAEAAQLHRRALASREQALGPDHPDTLRSVNGLAIVLWMQGNYAGAEALYRRVLESGERTLGSEHPDTLMTLNNLALCLSDRGNHTGAAELHRRALAGQEKVLGRDHPSTLMSINNLAMQLRGQGDLTGAEMLYRRALASRDKTLGLDHPDTLDSVNNLAVLLNQSGLLMEALQLVQERAALSATALASVRYNLACYECLSGNEAEACRLIAEEIVARPKLKEHALQDDDLKAIREFVGTL